MGSTSSFETNVSALNFYETIDLFLDACSVPGIILWHFSDRKPFFRYRHIEILWRVASCRNVSRGRLSRHIIASDCHQKRFYEELHFFLTSNSIFKLKLDFAIKKQTKAWNSQRRKVFCKTFSKLKWWSCRGVLLKLTSTIDRKSKTDLRNCQFIKILTKMRNRYNIS